MIVHQKTESGDLDAIPKSPTELLEEAKEQGMLDDQGKSSGAGMGTPLEKMTIQNPIQQMNLMLSPLISTCLKMA